MTDETPDNWEWSIGGRGGELHEGGYYDKYAYRTLPGSNQHVEKYLELHIYGEKDRHVLQLTERKEDSVESHTVAMLETKTWDVPDPETESQHQIFESKAETRARELMDEYADY